MARGLNTQDRRRAARVPPEYTPWRTLALLRPGRPVLLLNMSTGGALFESSHRMSPGMRTELQLSGQARQSVCGRISRCRVTALDPLKYEGAIVFDEPVTLQRETE